MVLPESQRNSVQKGTRPKRLQAHERVTFLLLRVECGAVCDGPLTNWSAESWLLFSHLQHPCDAFSVSVAKVGIAPCQGTILESHQPVPERNSP